VEQVKAIGITLVLAVVGTVVIAYAVKAVMGLRPTDEIELAGLDISEHGEEGYHGESGGHIVTGHPAIASAAAHPATATAKAIAG
jgi:hypothetical protein